MPLFREPLHQPGRNTFFTLLRFLDGKLKRFKSSIVEPSPDVNPAIHSEIRLHLCGQKTQTESPNLDYSNLNYLIPGHINRWEGTFKPLTQRGMIFSQSNSVLSDPAPRSIFPWKEVQKNVSSGHRPVMIPIPLDLIGASWQGGLGFHSRGHDPGGKASAGEPC